MFGFPTFTQWLDGDTIACQHWGMEAVRRDSGEALERVVASLRRVRVVRQGQLECGLVDAMAERLQRDGLSLRREVRLAPGCRIDLLVGGDGESLIGIEAKKGRPNATAVAAQLGRYAATGKLSAIVFVAERAFDLPRWLDGIPVRTVSLAAGMGIAL